MKLQMTLQYYAMATVPPFPPFQQAGSNASVIHLRSGVTAGGYIVANALGSGAHSMKLLRYVFRFYATSSLLCRKDQSLHLYMFRFL